MNLKSIIHHSKNKKIACKYGYVRKIEIREILVLPTHQPPTISFFKHIEPVKIIGKLEFPIAQFEHYTLKDFDFLETVKNQALRKIAEDLHKYVEFHLEQTRYGYYDLCVKLTVLPPENDPNKPLF